VLPEKWAANNSLGKHHVKILGAAQTQNRLMSRRPQSATGPYKNDLFLPAVVTGDRHTDIRLFQLCLAHERPPADIVEAGRFSINWMPIIISQEYSRSSQRGSGWPLSKGYPWDLRCATREGVRAISESPRSTLDASFHWRQLWLKLVHVVYQDG
jgi:hypothetical protein